jgi:hypothetical protein
MGKRSIRSVAIADGANYYKISVHAHSRGNGEDRSDRFHSYFLAGTLRVSGQER